MTDIRLILLIECGLPATKVTDRLPGTQLRIRNRIGCCQLVGSKIGHHLCQGRWTEHFFPAPNEIGIHTAIQAEDDQNSDTPQPRRSQ